MKTLFVDNKGVDWVVSEERLFLSHPTTPLSGAKGVPIVQVLKLALEHGLPNVKVAGKGAIPATPVRLGNWMAMKADQFTGIIPAEVNQMVAVFINQKLPVAGVVVLDDLDSPRYQPPKPTFQERVQQGKERLVARLEAVDWQRVGSITGQIVKYTALVCGVAALATIALPALAIGTLGVAALSFDPVYCIVIPDEEGCLIWYSLHEWYD